MLERIRHGEPAAAEQLLAIHRAELGKFVALRLDRRLRARLDASDVVQEALAEAAQRLAEFIAQPPMPFRLWLRRNAYLKLVSQMRLHLGADRRDVRREVMLPDDSSLALAEQLFAPGSTPSRQASRQEMAQRVRQAIGMLSETDREVVLMHTFDALTYQEIAYVLQIEPAAARKRHGRALLRLHKLLSADGFTDAQS